MCQGWDEQHVGLPQGADGLVWEADNRQGQWTWQERLGWALRAAFRAGGTGWNSLGGGSSKRVGFLEEVTSRGRVNPASLGRS